MHNSGTLVSVIIPCYNQARFLGEAIESVRRQTYPHFEIIVVDDGSTDDTPAVAARYEGVRVVRQRNQGAPVARNTGIDESRGEYLVFLDSDDRLLPDALLIGARDLDAHPECAFVSGHVRLISGEGRPLETPPQPHVKEGHFRTLLRTNYIWTPGAVMYRRAVFRHLAAFDNSAGGAADYELNIRIARRLPVRCHGEVVLEYRVHGENMSGDAAYMLKSAVRVCRSQRRHLKSDPQLLRAWKSGLRAVQEDYGGRLIEEVSAGLRDPRHRKKAWRGLLMLLRYYPRGLAGRLALKAHRLLGFRRTGA